MLADVAASRFEVYDSLARVYGLYATLNPDGKLAEFAFVLGWRYRNLLAGLAIYSIAFHTVCWATQASFFSGCAYSPGFRALLRLDPGSCLIDPAHLAHYCRPIDGRRDAELIFEVAVKILLAAIPDEKTDRLDFFPRADQSGGVVQPHLRQELVNRLAGLVVKERGEVPLRST